MVRRLTFFASFLSICSLTLAAAPPPLVIKSGGTYSGGTYSTVTIDTADKVVLDGNTLVGPGNLITVNLAGDLTITNNTASTAPPGCFLVAWDFINATVEHNKLTGTSGMMLWGQRNHAKSVHIRYNTGLNITAATGPTDKTKTSFIQLQDVHVPDIDISWNYVKNQPGLSAVEDNISLMRAGGTVGFPALVHDNFVDGAFAYPTGSDYSGGGIMCYDPAASTNITTGGYTHCYNNLVVGCEHYGVDCAGSHDIEIDHNRAVSDGTTTKLGQFAFRTFNWDNKTPASAIKNISVHDNFAYCLYNGKRIDYVMQTATSVANNTDGTSSDVAERANWIVKVAEAGIVLGPVIPPATQPTTLPATLPVVVVPPKVPATQPTTAPVVVVVTPPKVPTTLPTTAPVVVVVPPKTPTTLPTTAPVVVVKPPATQPTTAPVVVVKAAPLVPPKATKLTMSLQTLPAPPAYPYPLDANGWMILTPSAASKQVYVSNTAGNDTNAGDQAHPVQTIARAMKLIRPGQPDWIYLKNGDSFNENITGNLSGSGPTAHAVITSYGDPSLPRPRITNRQYSQLLLYGNNIAVIDLDFDAGRDPSQVNFTLVPSGGGVLFRGNNIIFEGNRCEWACGGNLDIEPNVTKTTPTPPPLTGIFVRRNVIAFAYSGGVGFSQGLHTDGLDSPLIEENFFHQNGWNPLVKLGTNAMFNHGCYNSWNLGARNSYFRGNIFSNNCSSGLQQRCGGVCYNNLFLNNGTAEDWTGEGNSEFLYMNVSTTSLDCPTAIGPDTTTFYNGGGFLYNAASGYIGKNIVCHGRTDAGFGAYSVSRNPGDKSVPSAAGLIEVGNNIVYDFYSDAFGYFEMEHKAVIFHDNIVQLCRRKTTNMRPTPASGTALTSQLQMANNLYDTDGQFWWQNTGMTLAKWSAVVPTSGDKISTVTFPAPTRTIEGYITANGLGKSYNDFAALAIQQRKGHMNPLLSAYSVNAYFQQGFGILPVPTTQPTTGPATQPATPVATVATSTFSALKFDGVSPRIAAVPLPAEKLGVPTSVGYTYDGTWVRYNLVDFGTGVKTFTATLGCQNDNAGHMIQVHVDSPIGATIAGLKVTGTGGWYKYVSESTPVTVSPVGVHNLYFVFNAPGTKQGVANVQSFTFTK